MDRIMSRIGLARIKQGSEIGMARLSAFARQFGTPRRRQIGKRIGLAGGGAAALSLAIFAAMPAGAQTQPLQYALPAQQAGVTLTIKAGPVTYSGATLAVPGTWLWESSATSVMRFSRLIKNQSSPTTKDRPSK